MTLHPQDKIHKCIGIPWGREMVLVTPLRRTLASSDLLPNPNALVAFSALTLLVGWQEGHPSCKKFGMVEVGTA